MDNKLKDLLPLLTAVSGILIAAFKDDMTPPGNYILLGLLALLVIAALAMVIARWVRNSKTMTSTAIVSKARKYSRSLIRLAKANEKQFRRCDYKYRKISDAKKAKTVAKHAGTDMLVPSKNTDAEKLKEAHDEILEDIRENSETLADSAALKPYEIVYRILDKASAEKIIKTNHIIIEGINDIERMLLQLEQHNNRITLGKYVSSYAEDELMQAKGFVDLIGWSNILIGHTRDGVKAIHQGIALLDEQLASPSIKAMERIADDKRAKIAEIEKHIAFDEISEQHIQKLEERKQELIDSLDMLMKSDTANRKYKLLLFKARAYRHLGSTYYTYRHFHDSKTQTSPKVIEYLQTSKNILNSLKGKITQADYDKMMDGVENNYWLCLLYDYLHCGKKCAKTVDEVTSILNEVNAKINTFSGDAKPDKHRLLKLYALRCQLNKALQIKTGEINMEELSSDLKQIESTLNKNIYFDDATEVYINEKIQCIFENVYEVLR